MVRNLAEELHQTTQAVPVRNDQNAFTFLEQRCNRLMPAWNDAICGILEAFGAGQKVGGQPAITSILRGLTLIGDIKRRRPNMPAASPGKDLFFTILFSCFGLVEALQRTIVPLVEPPGLPYR